MLFSAAKKVLVNGAKTSKICSKLSPLAFRPMVTLTEKEMGEETKYIRQKEREAMKAKIEKILDSEDSSEEKQQLGKLLGATNEEPQGMITKLGLNDWKFALPVGLLVGIPAVANEVIVLSEETQLTACFLLFCATMYTQVGGMAAKGLDDHRNEIENKFKALDDAVLSNITEIQTENKKLVELESNVKSLFELKDNLAIVKADALNQEEQHKFRDEIARKLDLLASLEDSAVAALKSRMISKVKADVLKKFKTDQAAKDAALSSAIAVIAAGAKGKLGKDVVGEAFSASIASYTAEYKKQPEGSDEIIKKLEKDVAALIKPPTFDKAGGNVYENHKFFI